MGSLLWVLVVMCPAVVMMRSRSERRRFHTVVTSSESVYNTWQCRVMYYWFQKQRKESMEMGGFTRILHSGEPDHLLVKPIPNLSEDGGHTGAAFPFFYIQPHKQEVLPLPYGADNTHRSHQKFPPQDDCSHLDKPFIGHENEAFLEMYAYAVASAIHGVPNILHKELMIQPPWDTAIGKAYIIHYTYGCDYDSQVDLWEDWRVEIR